MANLSQISRPIISSAVRLKIATMTLIMAWGAEAYNEDGTALDGERDIARDLVELLLKRYGRVPRFPP